MDNINYHKDISKEKIKEYIKIKADNERNSWAFVLKIIRKYRVQKIDLMPGIRLEDMQRKIYAALRSYEKTDGDLILFKLEREGKLDPMDLKDFFTKYKDLDLGLKNVR